MVLDYCNNFRKDRFWTVISEEEELKRIAGNAMISLYGYKNQIPEPGEVPEIITLYAIYPEDPDEDPYKELIRGDIAVIDEFLSVNEREKFSPAEIESLEFARQRFQHLIDVLDNPEAEAKCHEEFEKKQKEEQQDEC